VENLNFKNMCKTKKLLVKRDQSFLFKKRFLPQHKGIVTMKMLFHSLRMSFPGSVGNRDRESELSLEKSSRSTMGLLESTTN
jgi:hypothetical protein